MGKLVLRTAVVLLLALCFCTWAAAETADTEDAGWQITRTSELTEEAIAAFSKAAGTLTDTAVCEPVALLGENEGIYCILCRVTGDDPGSEPYYTLVYAGQDGVQNVWDLWIADHSTPKNMEKEERIVDYSVFLGDLAAYREAMDLITEDLDRLNEELAAFVSKKWQEIYMNPEYRLYLDGRDDPAGLPVTGKHAFVVLGYELKDGEMTDELKARCDAAAAAAEAFPESVLICSGGATGENNPEMHTEAGLMKEYLIRTGGIAAERIFTDESAMSTLENAQKTFAILKEQGIEEITVVTSSYHQRRANILYETLAEMIRETEGTQITVIGNYGCEREAPRGILKADARIAAMQLNELLTAAGGKGSIDYLAVVNKTKALPEGWEDALETVTVTNSVGDEVEVEKKAYEAYLLLKADLEQHDGIFLELDSARRSVAAQQDIMDRFTEKYGADYAAKTVAAPGYSEHHTGLALDLYFRIRSEGGTFTDVYYNEDMTKPEYKWIWDRIHEKLADSGFILRYLKGKEYITGYGYEPWHIRYLDSVYIAKEIMSQPGMTLEAWLGTASDEEPVIDYGTSALYSREELEEAAVQVMCRFASFAGCELHMLRYAGDECNTEENIRWMNEHDEGKGYVQVAEFLSDFHSPVSPGEDTAWEPDQEYTGYQWWLARTVDGGWQLLDWGY